MSRGRSGGDLSETTWMTTSTFAAMSRCMCLCSGSGRASTVRRGRTDCRRQTPPSFVDAHAVADRERALLPHGQLRRDDAVELFAVAQARGNGRC